MVITLLNFNLVSVIFIAFLVVTTLYIYLSYKNKSQNIFRFILFFRIIAISVIIFIFIHPLLTFQKETKNNKSLHIYVDNSSSMKNNIALDSLQRIIRNISDYNSKEYDISLYLFGDSLRSLKGEITFSDSYTDFKELRNFIINNNSDQNLVISDGLNYLNSHNYRLSQSINLIGVGLVGINNNLSIKDAFINGDLIDYTINYDNIAIDSIKVELLNSDKLIDYEVINLSNKNNSIVKSFNLSSLGLMDYENLNIYVNTVIDNNEFDNYANIFYDKYAFKDTYIITGIPSFNTQFLKREFEKINKNVFHSVFEDNFNINYDKTQLVVFDNYPFKTNQIEKFDSIIQKLNKYEIPFIIVFGPNQEYDIISQISYNFNFSIQNKIKENLKIILNDNHSDIILDKNIPPTSYYKLSSDNNNSDNIYYSNKAPAVLFEKNMSLIFLPDLSKMVYRAQKDGLGFNRLISSLFKQIYYKDNYLYIYSDRDKFYNNESIDIKLFNNSQNIYNDLVLKIEKNDNTLYTQYQIKDNNINKYVIPSIKELGKYHFYLLNEGEIVSNKLTVDIYNYNKEDMLKGQNAAYLNKIAKQSGGLYSNEREYMNNLKNNTANSIANYKYNLYDSKDYLFVLLLSITSLIIDWYLRKKRGLL